MLEVNGISIVLCGIWRLRSLSYQFHELDIKLDERGSVTKANIVAGDTSSRFNIFHVSGLIVYALGRTF